MLALIRTQPPESPVMSMLDATVTLRDGNAGIGGKPDLAFSIKTYEKIAKVTDDNTGDQILLPINLFFNSLDLQEQITLYDMYRFARVTIAGMNKDNRRELQDDLQEKIYNTLFHLSLGPKIIAFCQTPQFIYPDLSDVGTKAHHSPEKTFLLQDYVEITAISLLSKMMVPIWGEFIGKLRALEVDVPKIEKIAFDLIEPTLEDAAFERIYHKLYTSLSNLVREKRSTSDKKAMVGGVLSSYILTHNGIDDDMFNTIVMATIIVKRMATYECFARHKNENAIPNAMVYIDDGIKRTSETRIQSMRSPMRTMPRKELPQHDTEDNQSIIDHASKTSSKPIDVPILVTTATEEWELPKLLETLDVPQNVFHTASRYYLSNSFDVSPLCQAMVASFIGTRFGGSKCLGYLPPRLYQQIVVILQVFLIRNNFLDLATLVSSKTSAQQIEGAQGSMSSRIDGKLKSEEYLQCQSLFKGWVEKPVVPFGKRPSGRNKMEVEKLDFTTHIAKMKEWLIRYNHAENMAPSLWTLAGSENMPVAGSEVQYSETIFRSLCKFYLMFHGTQRPF